MTTTSSSAREQEVVAAARVDDAWEVVEEFAQLVRESGTDEERQAIEGVIRRLDAWGVPYTLHEPEVRISLPRGAALVVDGEQIAAKTPSMSLSTGDTPVTGELVYEPSAYATSSDDIFAAAAGTGDVAGKIVMTEGFPMPGKVADLERRGAAAVVAIAPGERIHEGICTSVWGSPDLTSFHREPNVVVIAISKPDGQRLIEKLEAGPAQVEVTAQHETRWRTIPVLVAQIDGQVEPERFVLVHGHLDSWHVGIGDNATGDATLLELARVLWAKRDALDRSVRIAWWSGHSHGRYAGSTWFADEFAIDLEENCICHVNCDSPGCRDASSFEEQNWMAEVEAFASQAINDFTGLPSEGRHPLRAGDISFNNLGVTTFFMLSSTIPAEELRRRGYYAVGGCGANIEWHTEADLIDVADRDNLLRDIRLYLGAAYRVANSPVHPLDFRATLAQIETVLAERRPQLSEFAGLGRLDARLAALRQALDALYAHAGTLASVAEARPVNDALLEIARQLVNVLYSSAGRYRQDPALDIPLLPDFAHAVEAIGTVPDGVVRTEAVRARNRLEGALIAATKAAARAIA